MMVWTAIPWIFLAFRRPDKAVSQQIEVIDSALAHLVQVMLERLDELSDLGSSLAVPAENPLMSILQTILNNRLNDENVYERADNGTFTGQVIDNGTTQESN
jgi:hypothetical protein